MRFKIPKEGKK